MPSRAGFWETFTVTALGLLTACDGGRGGGSDDGSSGHTSLSMAPNIYGANPAPIWQISDLNRAIGVYDDLMEIQTVVEDVNDAMSSTPVAYSLGCSDYFSPEASNFEAKGGTSNALMVAILA